MRKSVHYEKEMLQMPISLQGLKRWANLESLSIFVLFKLSIIQFQTKKNNKNSNLNRTFYFAGFLERIFFLNRNFILQILKQFQSNFRTKFFAKVFRFLFLSFISPFVVFQNAAIFMSNGHCLERASAMHCSRFYR